MFSTLPNTNFKFLVTFIFSSANASNWDRSELMSFGKELNQAISEFLLVLLPFCTSPTVRQRGIFYLPCLYFNPFPNDKFWTLPIRKGLQTTILNLVEIAESSPKW